MASQQQLAQQHRRQQAVLRAGVVQQVLQLWLQLFDPSKASVSWPAVRAALMVLVRDRAVVSGLMAVRYYTQARDTALSARPGAAPSFTPQPVRVVGDEVIGRNVDSTGVGTFLRGVKSGQAVETARRNAGVQLSGAASKLVVDVGRDTIQQAVLDDSAAIGWARITDAKPCAFCAMLASRGPAYTSKKTASFQAHDHCACTAAPVFAGDEVWLQHGQELADRWQQATAGKSGRDAMVAWRRHWEGR